MLSACSSNPVCTGGLAISGMIPGVNEDLPDEVTADGKLPSLNDEFEIDEKSLDDPKNVERYKFRQNCNWREVEYVQSTAFISGGIKSQSFMFFIEKDKISAFREANRTSDGKLKAKITSAYQYGQGDDKLVRWVVLHDHANKLYQHRFLKTGLTRYKEQMEGFVSSCKDNLACNGGIFLAKTFVPNAKMIENLAIWSSNEAENSVGNYLRTYNK